MSAALHWLGLGLAATGSLCAAALVVAQVDSAGAWGLAVCGAICVAAAHQPQRSLGGRAPRR